MTDDVIKNLGDWAEDRFAGLCAAAGVTRNKSTQDRAGWDYIIQFPSPETPEVPADMLPGEDSARVQIKSKASGRPTIPIKLTNALRFAKDPTPCFIVLFLASRQKEPARVYAKHFWIPEMEAALRRARLADQEGRADLHKIKISIPFNDRDEHSNDLLSWIAKTIRAEGGRYTETKAALIRNLGFEEGFIHGTISIANKDLGAWIDHQIGLAPTAPVLNTNFKQRRFGIDARKPLFSGKPTVAHIQSRPEPCRVRIRSLNANDVWLDGDLLLPVAAGVPLELCKLRVVADFLEIIISGDRQGTMNVKFNGNEQRSIPRLRALIDVRKSAEKGPLHFQINSAGRPSLPITFTLPSFGNAKDLQQLSNILACLEAVSAGILPADLTLSLAEIYAAWNAIVDFNGLVTGSDFLAKFKLETAIDPSKIPAASIQFFDYVDVGAWSFLAVVRRPITKFTLIDSYYELHCDSPRVVESLVKPGSGRTFLPELQELYQQSTDFESIGVLEICGGDYRAMRASNGVCTLGTIPEITQERHWSGAVSDPDVAT